MKERRAVDIRHQDDIIVHEQSLHVPGISDHIGIEFEKVFVAKYSEFFERLLNALISRRFNKKPDQPSR